MSAAKNSSNLSNNSTDAHEDELFAWLQYPVDDAFDRNYCSEFLGGLLSPPHKAVAAKTHSDAHPPARCFADVGVSTCTGSTGSSKLPLKKNVGSKLFARPSSTADNALALGAARAAGQSSQVGQDAFNRVRISMHPQETIATPCVPLKAFEHKALKPEIPTPCASKSTQGGVDVHSLHMANRFSKEKTKHSAFASTSPAAEKSRNTRETHSQQLPHTQQSRSSHITDEPSNGRVCGKYTSSHGSTASLLGNAKMQGPIATSSNSWGVKGKMARTDQTSETLPSYSGGSQTSMSLSFKEVMYSGKRKHDVSEPWSEDVDDKARNAKAQHKSSSRRNRVTEVHNLSERNRRNRINEKLKALQDLIPNSSKADKASVLDEAIEYMKTLQIQLQMVSMRSSMNMTPMMVPMAFPPTPMHMAPLHSIGLGVPVGHAGIGMGLGMGLNMDMRLPPQSGRAAPFQSGPAEMIQYGMPLESGNMALLHNNGQTCTNAGFLHTYPPASMQKIHVPFEHTHPRSLTNLHAHNCQQQEEGQHLGYLYEHEQVIEEF